MGTDQRIAMDVPGGGHRSEDVALEEGKSEDKQELVRQLEDKVNGLEEDEISFLLSNEDIQKKIMQEAIETQRARLQELKDLLQLIKELNQHTHAQSDKLDEISAKVDKSCREYISSGKSDLQAAKESANAIRRKKRIMLVFLILALIVAGVVIYVLV